MKKKIIVYLNICDLVNSPRIIEATNKWFIVELDIEKNNKLAEDLNKKNFVERISQRRVEKKIRHGCIMGNLFVTYKIMKYF